MAALLELACRKNQAAELYEETFEEVALGFQSNRLKSVDTSTGAGIGLRVIRNGHIGFASSSQGDNEKFLLDSAVAAAEYGQVCHSEFPHSAPATQVECFDPEIPNVSTDQMAEEGTRAIEQLVREVQGFQCEAEIARTIITTHISNSRGLDVSYRKTVYSFGVYAFLGREGDFLGVGDSLSACNYNQWADYIATRIIERIKLSQKKATIETGSYPAIFTPRAIPVILGPIRRGINGKMVQKDISPLSSRLNEQIMDSSLTVSYTHLTLPTN